MTRPVSMEKLPSKMPTVSMQKLPLKMPKLPLKMPTVSMTKAVVSTMVPLGSGL